MPLFADRTPSRKVKMANYKNAQIGSLREYSFRLINP